MDTSLDRIGSKLDLLRSLLESHFPGAKGDFMKSIAFTQRIYDLPYVAEYAYIDLRSHPERIDEIPELRWEPSLKPLVSILNDPSGMFMTHACAIGRRRPGVPGSTIIRIPYGAKDAPCWYSSYVIFSFWFLNQNTGDHYKAIYDSYPSDKNESNVAFEIEPAYFCTPQERVQGEKLSGSDTNGTVCGLWMSGWGISVQEAQHRWVMGINDIVAFFTRPLPALDNLSASTGVTLSQHMFG